MSDARVEAAIAHWAPRYVEHGVPIGDFLDVTRSIESWNEWCAAWTAAGRVHEALGDEALSHGYTRSAGGHYLTAAVEYHFGKFLFCHDIDQMRATHQLAVAAHRKAHPLVDPPMERIEFDYLGNQTLVGNLRKPNGIDRPPVVLLIPGLDSAKEELSGFEFWFLDRGMATFSFDGPGQGEAEYALPIETAYEKPAGAAIDALEARDDVDVGRLGAMGVSLGGYYVVRAAAYEKRIKAMISLSGPHTINDTIDETPPMSQLAFQVRTHSPDFTTAKGKLTSMDLTGVAELVSCPSFVVTGANDRIVPADQTRRIAEAITGPVHLQIIEDANHVATSKAYVVSAAHGGLDGGPTRCANRRSRSISMTAAYTSRVTIERVRGPMRNATIPARDEPVTFGVHSEVAEHYGVSPDDFPPDATTLDYLVAAAGG